MASLAWNQIVCSFIVCYYFDLSTLLALQEEPFTILPMQAFCDKIYNWCFEIMSWQPGDNGRPQKPIRPEHEFFAAVEAPPPRM